MATDMPVYGLGNWLCLHDPGLWEIPMKPPSDDLPINGGGDGESAGEVPGMRFWTVSLW